jgi:hypothetical protein
MILRISINDTEIKTETLEAALEQTRYNLDDLGFSNSKELAVSLITRMYKECDILSLTVNLDTLTIRKI